MYNVLSYGAVGDGTTDDSAAIQNAVDTANGAGGGSIYFPGGYTFAVANSLIIKDNITMFGDGKCSTIKASPSIDPAASNVIKTIGTGIITSNIAIYNLNVDGNKDNVTIGDPGNEGSQSGIVIDQADGVDIDLIQSNNCVQNGIYIVNSTVNVNVLNSNYLNNGKVGAVSGGRGAVFGVSCKYFKVHNCYVSGNLVQGILVQAEGGDNTNNFIISNNIIYANGSRGIDIGDNAIANVNYNIYIQQGMVVDNIITNNAGDGIRLFQSMAANGFGAIGICEDIMICGNVIKANGGNGINLIAPAAGKVDYSVIKSNTIRKNTLKGINVGNTNCRFTSIMNNDVMSNFGGDYADAGTATVKQYNNGI